MTSDAAALPRAKRRRRRPPNRRERRALFACGVDALFTLILIQSFVSDASTFCRAVALVCSVVYTWFFVNVDWPVVWNYIRNGYLDE